MSKDSINYIKKILGFKMENTLDKKIKIYFLSNSSFSDNQLNILINLKNNFDIRYSVLIPKVKSNYTKEELDNFFYGSTIKTDFLQLKFRFRNPRLIVSYLKLFFNIRKDKPDIIYFANFDDLYLNTVLMLLNTSKTIIAFHDVESHSGTPFNYLVKLSKKILIAKFKYFQTFSETQSNILIKNISNKKIFNISLPQIDFGVMPEVSKNTALTNFLFFGNILPYKGLELLINEFKDVAACHNNVRLTIAGRCNDWNDKFSILVKDCSQIKSDIRFIENKEIPKLFSTTDYLILPYRDTTQSGPLMIAYNYNIPVLVSNAIGFKEFTEEGVTGFTFNTEIPGDLAKKLLDCISRSNEEYKSLKNKLLLFTEERFSVNAISIKYEQMFTEVYNS